MFQKKKFLLKRRLLNNLQFLRLNDIRPLNNKSALTYFIADLHLAQNRPDITACFLSFLKNEAPNAEKLYILGDLFEYWIGDDDDSPFILADSTSD